MCWSKLVFICNPVCIFYGSWLPAVTLRNSFERELMSLVFTSFASVVCKRQNYKVTASSSVQSTSHWVVAPLYLVMEGGFFHTEMTGSDKTDRTQSAGMLDKTRAHLTSTSPQRSQLGEKLQKGKFQQFFCSDHYIFLGKVLIHKCGKPGIFHLLGPCQPEGPTQEKTPLNSSKTYF